VEDPLEEQHRWPKSPWLTDPRLTDPRLINLPQQEPTISRLTPHTQLNTPETRRTRGIHTDYRKLNDPFIDDEEDADEETLHTQYINAAEIGGDIHSLTQAQKSEEWPEWKSAILLHQWIPDS